MCTHGKLYRNVRKTPCLSFIFFNIILQRHKKYFPCQIESNYTEFLRTRSNKHNLFYGGIMFLMSSINGNSFATTTKKDSFYFFCINNFFFVAWTFCGSPKFLILRFLKIFNFISFEVVFNFHTNEKKNWKCILSYS